jgi:NAD(P) transhydrogenase subunit alpha
MRIGIVKETFPGERRVALVPAHAGAIVKAGMAVIVERGAGLAAGHVDEKYVHHGAQIAARGEVFAADVVLAVRTLGANPIAGKADLPLLRRGQVLIGLADPLGAAAEAKTIADTGATLFALELLPRITRAQSMDVLSSMATIAGYRAVLLAATALTKMFPMMMTAAGTLTAAKVLVIGAGVAGLQAIATARKLGAVVRAYDVRDAAKEQIQSLGAKFVDLGLSTAGAEGAGGYAQAMDADFYRRQREKLADVVADCDVVITTAAIPGQKSPLLVTRDGVERMAPGSVVVDLAAERGGNCELTQADQTVVHGGVTILGPTNPAGDIPFHASQMFSKNISAFFLHLVIDGKLTLNTDDEIIRETLVARDGQVVHPRVKKLLTA